uniref:U-box domain-containing protein n=1 Tax=Haptolina ericina TaxID=156174 RepID=A0A7S3AKT9_9EUKA|mmetsp:Transcript_23858/g.54310  ORF Transcript_23858/g.54310 Transcript_23858/m.54310 type:complete len:258 (+) Transcript_23858:148-921(+)
MSPNDDALHAFVCPISGDVMRDPVSCADGHTYERSEIERWLATGACTSPSTGARLPHLHVVPNHALRCAIEEWLSTKGGRDGRTSARGRRSQCRMPSTPMSISSRLEASERLEYAAREAEAAALARSRERREELERSLFELRVQQQEEEEAAAEDAMLWAVFLRESEAAARCPRERPQTQPPLPATSREQPSRLQAMLRYMMRGWFRDKGAARRGAKSARPPPRSVRSSPQSAGGGSTNALGGSRFTHGKGSGSGKG